MIEPNKDLGHSGEAGVGGGLPKPTLEATEVSPAVAPAAEAPPPVDEEAYRVPTIADYEPRYKC